jgi:hypothetical protein
MDKYQNLKGKTIELPSGWMYKFPKKFEPKNDETLEQFIIREGYPKNEVQFAIKYMRILD